MPLETLSATAHLIGKYIGLAIILYLAISATRQSSKTDDSTAQSVYTVGAYLLCALAFILLSL